MTGHVGTAAGIHRDGVSAVGAVAAQISGIDQRTAIRTELVYKRRSPLPGRNAVALLLRRRRTLIRVLCREVYRVGRARHVRAACAVHRKGLRDTDLKVTGSGRNADAIIAGPGQIAGIAEDGVDDQLLGMVVAAQPEAYLVPGHGVPPFHPRLLVSIHLVQHRLLEGGRAVGGAQNRVALRVGAGSGAVDRSEERRVGKECRSRWSPYP